MSPDAPAGRREVAPLTPQVIRAEAAARYVGLAVETLRKLRQEGRGPAYEKHGRLVYYRVVDLDVWLDGQVTERFEPNR